LSFCLGSMSSCSVQVYSPAGRLPTHPKSKGCGSP